MSYVSKTGNDQSGDGTVDNPWLTIQHGIDHNQDDVLVVREGVDSYHEVLRHNRWNHIKAYDGELPVIDGRAGVDGLNEGLPHGKAAWIAKDGKHFNWNGLIDFIASDVVMEGFKIIGSMGRTVRFLGTGGILKNCLLGNGRGTGVVFEGTGGNKIIDCDVYDMMNFAPYPRGSGELNWGAGIITVKDGNSIINCRVFENWGEGIIAGRESETTIIEKCTVYDNFAGQIYIDSAALVDVLDNIVWFANPAFYRGGKPSFGIILNNEVNQKTRDVRVLRNRVGGCSDNIGMWDGVQDVLIEENTLIEAYFYAVVARESGYSNTRIINNTIYQEDPDKVWDITSGITEEGNIINPGPPPPIIPEPDPLPTTTTIFHPPPEHDHAQILARLDKLELDQAQMSSKLMAQEGQIEDLAQVQQKHAQRLDALMSIVAENATDLDEIWTVFNEIANIIINHRLGEIQDNGE